MWSPNNAEWVITQFATAKAGLILVNINPAYRLAELEYALNKAGCVALITATWFKASDYIGMLRELAPELASAAPGNLRASRLPELRLVITVGADAAHGTVRFEDVSHLAGDADRHRLAGLAGCATARVPQQKRSALSARARSPITRCRAMSNSSTASR